MFALIMLLLVGAVLVAYGTVAKTKWGINFSPPKQCPKCAEPLAQIRMPKGSDEAMWGGFTCSKCGYKMDKWGNPRAGA